MGFPTPMHTSNTNTAAADAEASVHTEMFLMSPSSLFHGGCDSLTGT